MGAPETVTPTHAECWVWAAVRMSPVPLSCWEIAERTGWFPGTVLALLLGLEREGYLVKREGWYSPGRDLVAELDRTTPRVWTEEDLRRWGMRWQEPEP